jgi:hypothetical protein
MTLPGDADRPSGSGTLSARRATTTSAKMAEGADGLPDPREGHADEH